MIDPLFLMIGNLTCLMLGGTMISVGVNQPTLNRRLAVTSLALLFCVAGAGCLILLVAQVPRGL